MRDLTNKLMNSKKLIGNCQIQLLGNIPFLWNSNVKIEFLYFAYFQMRKDNSKYQALTSAIDEIKNDRHLKCIAQI